MLNRMNLTLSALSHGLELGARSLVLNASVNHGGQTLRIAHPDHDVMREGIAWDFVSYFATSKYDIPVMPGSMIPGQPRQLIRCAGQEEASRSAREARDVVRSYATGLSTRTTGATTRKRGPGRAERPTGKRNWRSMARQAAAGLAAANAASARS